MNRLRTLGSLSLEDSGFAGPKSLALLTYLALEGPQSRRRLASLFWPEAADPLNQLSVTLVRLGRLAPGTFRASPAVVESTLACDAVEMQAALRNGEYELARRLYRGRFFLGVHLRAVAGELDEWIEDGRDRLARDLQSKLLASSRELLRVGRFSQSASLVRDALSVADVSLMDVADLSLAHEVLAASRDPAAREVMQEIASLVVAEGNDRDEVTLRSSTRRAAGELAGANGSGDTVASDTDESFRVVGRREERALLARLITAERRRCVTVTGPGGIGKSRLAEAVAVGLSREGAFAGGLGIVRCHDLPDDQAVRRAIYESLGVPLPTGGPTVKQLTEVLAAGPRTLLLLDDYDHLAGRSAWLNEVLIRTPRLYVLVTSVAPLGSPEERVLQLEGLAFDGPYGGDAGALFLESARRADATFEVADTDVPYVRELARITGGSPLALEMAAALVTVMQVSEIVQEIGQGADVLTAASPTNPRHRSVLTVFERCWSLCDERERFQMAKLAAFSGPFGRKEAESVADVGPSDLANLLRKSLLARSEHSLFEVRPMFRSWIRGVRRSSPGEHHGEIARRPDAGPGRLF